MMMSRDLDLVNSLRKDFILDRSGYRICYLYKTVEGINVCREFEIVKVKVKFKVCFISLIMVVVLSPREEHYHLYMSR